MKNSKLSLLIYFIFLASFLTAQSNQDIGNINKGKLLLELSSNFLHYKGKTCFDGKFNFEITSKCHIYLAKNYFLM